MKIIQLLQTDETHWDGRLLGLGDDGVTYEVDGRGLWVEFIPVVGVELGKEVYHNRYCVKEYDKCMVVVDHSAPEYSCIERYFGLYQRTEAEALCKKLNNL